MQRAHDGIHVSAGQVGASNAAGKERVSGDKFFLGRKNRGSCCQRGVPACAWRWLRCRRNFSLSWSRKGWSSMTLPGDSMPTHFACLSRMGNCSRSASFIKMGAPVEARRLHCSADVIDVRVGDDDMRDFELFFRDDCSISSISAPGSTTMHSRDFSSPRMEQLHCRGPSGITIWDHGNSLMVAERTERQNRGTKAKASAWAEAWYYEMLSYFSELQEQPRAESSSSVRFVSVRS